MVFKAEEVHDKMLTRLANEGDPIAQVALCEGLMKLLRYELSANHEVGVKYSPRNKKHFQRRVSLRLCPYVARCQAYMPLSPFLCLRSSARDLIPSIDRF